MIYDMLGRRVGASGMAVAGTNKINILVAAIAAGMYTVKIISGMENSSVKFLKR